MPMMRAVLTACLLALSILPARAQDKVPVSLRIESGDTGLTRDFARALDAALSKSDSLVAKARASDGMFMIIPRDIHWALSGDKVRFYYVVVFTDRASWRYLGTSMGDCAREDTSECAGRVISDAEYAARNR